MANAYIVKKMYSVQKTYDQPLKTFASESEAIVYASELNEAHEEGISMGKYLESSEQKAKEDAKKTSIEA